LTCLVLPGSSPTAQKKLSQYTKIVLKKKKKKKKTKKKKKEKISKYTRPF